LGYDTFRIDIDVRLPVFEHQKVEVKKDTIYYRTALRMYVGCSVRFDKYPQAYTLLKMLKKLGKDGIIKSEGDGFRCWCSKRPMAKYSRQ